MSTLESSLSVEDTKSGLGNATFVVVTGLQGIDSYGKASKDVPYPVIWEPDGVIMAHYPGSHCIRFSPDFAPKIVDELSPEYFNRVAVDLLAFVSEATKETKVRSTVIRWAKI
ncbi:hypothetical protein GGR53DRAFT_482011 [Hypoxylon sp. FL1150]|nr:hypothetical protein GGR53DRAFT_482011 [Hypoxylon sp. FL1150]